MSTELSTGKLTEREITDLVAQFAPDHATTIGAYLWRVETGIIHANGRFQKLCPNLGEIKASPDELRKELNRSAQVERRVK